MANVSEPIELPFKPRARLLQLLGDQLIGTSRLAVFELIKNAYDADADEVIVTLHNIDKKNARIVTKDDGDGMSLKTIENIWLVPGDDHREKQRISGKRSRKGRLPLGEKGLGRFAAHKLGNKIELVTKSEGNDECVVIIDWASLLKNEFLSDAIVTVTTRTPEVFTAGKTGTQISISELRGHPWTRGEVRKLYRQVTSMGSPFELNILTNKNEEFPIKDFKASLDVPGHNDWLRGIPSVKEILGLAFWHCQFRIENGVLSWSYKFRSIPELGINENLRNHEEPSFPIPDPLEFYEKEEPDGREKEILASPSMQKEIGPISGEFYIFDRDRVTQQFVPSLSKASTFLDFNGGIRVYRDGVRVYNYGEPGDDWLSLDHWRVQDPTRRVSNNIIAGAVNILLEHSSRGLREKASREGFDENEWYFNFQALILGTIRFFMAEYSKDKNRIRLITKKKVDPEIEKIRKPLSELRKLAAKKNVLADFEKLISKIEIDYDDMQRTMLQAGMSNLSLALVFHEVVRGVKALAQSAATGASLKDIKEQAEHLNKLLDGITGVLRTDEPKTQSVAKVIRQARRFYQGRLVFHKIQIEAPLIDSDEGDFEAKFSFGMILNALTNVLDNSIHWLQLRWPDNNQTEGIKRALYIGISHDIGDGPALVIADNGPGFRPEDTPEDLVRPFFTRKVTDRGKRGMGLGLYYTNMALEINNAKLVFTNAKDAGIPEKYDGAVIAFLFEEE